LTFERILSSFFVCHINFIIIFIVFFFDVIIIIVVVLLLHFYSKNFQKLILFLKLTFVLYVFIFRRFKFVYHVNIQTKKILLYWLELSLHWIMEGLSTVRTIHGIGCSLLCLAFFDGRFEQIYIFFKLQRSLNSNNGLTIIVFNIKLL